MHYVIGSGPASISAAVALVNRGLKVTIIDPGKTLEEHAFQPGANSETAFEAVRRIDMLGTSILGEICLIALAAQATPAPPSEPACSPSHPPTGDSPPGNQPS